MPRRNPRSGSQHRPISMLGHETVQQHSDGEWHVRAVGAGAACKTYRCPGCDHEIRPGTAHVVAWPTGDVEGRRHWHTPCWKAKDRRRPGRKY